MTRRKGVLNREGQRFISSQDNKITVAALVSNSSETNPALYGHVVTFANQGSVRCSDDLTPSAGGSDGSKCVFVYPTREMY